MEAAVIPPPPTTLPSDPPTKDPAIITSTPNHTPLQLTTSKSPTYRDRAALICARAAITDPFTRVLTHERLAAASPNTPPPEPTVQALYAGNVLRLLRKIDQGASIVEVNDFAAVACWEPPEVSEYESAEIWDGVDVGRVIPDAERRPIFMRFLKGIAHAKRKTFPRGQRYWHLSLMAREPDRSDKGAVRAIIEPYVKQARREGVPLWLEAGNPRARDVYAWVGGFWVVEEIKSGVGEFDGRGDRKEGGEGVSTFLMVSNWPVEEVKG